MNVRRKGGRWCALMGQRIGGRSNCGPMELLVRAGACAEATSALDCMVPLSSLLLRRFRSEFIKPLLQKDENWCPAVTAGSKAKSRLACTVNQMQRAKGGDENEN
jgi:hypothetical protein